MGGGMIAEWIDGRVWQGESTSDENGVICFLSWGINFKFYFNLAEQKLFSKAERNTLKYMFLYSKKWWLLKG